VNANAEKVLNRIADAEAKAHGISRDEVHFHEIGAIDTIIDIVGACLGIEYLGVSRSSFQPSPRATDHRDRARAAAGARTGNGESDAGVSCHPARY